MSEDTRPRWDKNEAKQMIRKWLSKGAWPSDLVSMIDKEARDHSAIQVEQFCRMYWDIEDVQCLFVVTDQEAVDFLRESEEDFVADMTELGYDKLEELGKARGFTPTEE